MNPRQERAAAGFVLGIVGLAALQAVVDRDAKELGLPHAVAGLIVAIIAHSLE